MISQDDCMLYAGVGSVTLVGVGLIAKVAHYILSGFHGRWRWSMLWGLLKATFYGLAAAAAAVLAVCFAWGALMGLGWLVVQVLKLLGVTIP